METIFDLLGQLTAFVDSLVALVTDSPLTYLLILAMAAIDVVVPLLPAEATVTAAAVLAGQGQLNIAWVMLAAGVGAFVGDNVAYWIGRAAGRPLVERVLHGHSHQIEGVAAQFERRGGLFIIIGRFVPGGRTAVAIGAGVLRFSWPRFLLYDGLAAVVWAFQAAIPGFIGGRLIQGQPWLAMVIGFVLSAVLATTIALLQRWWDGRRAVPVELPLKPAVLGIGGFESVLDPEPPSLEGEETSEPTAIE
jgi:membrane-associated protein